MGYRRTWEEPTLIADEDFDPLIGSLIGQALADGYIELQEAPPMVVEYRKVQKIVRWSCPMYQRDRTPERFL